MGGSSGPSYCKLAEAWSTRADTFTVLRGVHTRARSEEMESAWNEYVTIQSRFFFFFNFFFYFLYRHSGGCAKDTVFRIAVDGNSLSKLQTNFTFIKRHLGITKRSNFIS